MYPYCVVIDSKEELEAYYDANKEQFDLERKEKVYSDTTIGFLDACDKYDDAYFERQNLELILLQEGSGSVRHEITDVRRYRLENGASDGWAITIKSKAPEVVTDDMAQWHLFLEVQMGDVIESDDAVWINGIPSECVTIQEFSAVNFHHPGNQRHGGRRTDPFQTMVMRGSAFTRATTVASRFSSAA